jgi:maltose/moltooligosaccharide transporter
VGVLFASYNGFAALAAFLIPVLANRFGRRVTHLICMVAGGLGLASFLVIQDPTWLLLSMVGVGIAWASILSVPYAILSGSLPSNKMGVYMGIFNFFIVIPQILAASILGFMVRTFFDGQAIYALLLGGIFMVISGLVTLRVEDNDHA